MRAATKKTLLILFLALSLPALANAVTLDNTSLQWNGHDITTINPHRPTAASLSITLGDAAEVETVTLDYTGLNPGGDGTAEIDSGECIYDRGSLICYAQNLAIQPRTGEAVINITATLANGTEKEFSRAFSFTIDETSPEVTFLGTEACHEGTCYAQSGYTTVVIEMQDNVASFNKMRVAFSLDGKKSLVARCDGMTCKGASTKRCDDGDTIPLDIVAYNNRMESQDDAGNAVVGTTSSNVVCDAQEPEFSSDVEIETTGITTHEERERPFVAMGDTATLTFNVTERTSPTLEVVAELSELGEAEKEGSCSREAGSDTWTCTVSFQATPSQLGTYTIPLEVTDLAGNNARKSDFTFDVVERRTGPVDLWTVEDPESQVANKGFLEFTPKRLFVPLTLSSKNSGKQLILDAEMTGTCVPLEKQSEDDVTYGRNGDLSFRVASVAGNNVLLRGELHAGTHYYDLDYLKYNCSFNVQTLRGDYLSTVEHEMFTLTFKLHDSDTIGQKVMEEVEVELNDTVKRLGWVSGTRKWLSGMAAVCQIPGVLKGAGGALNSAAAMLDPTPAKAASDSANEGGRMLGLTAEQLRPITSVCKVLTCNLNFFEDKVLGGTDLSETKIGEGLADANLDIDKAMNPYSSLASSIVTMCPTAAVYHIDRYASIDCNYAMCLSRNVRSGQATIDQCQQQRSYATCKFVWGEVWGSVPFYSFAKDSLQSLVQVVSDPVSFFGGVAISAACGSAAITKNSVAEKLCLAADNLKKMNSAVQEVKQVSEQVRILFSKQQLGREVCGPVKDHIDKASTYWDYTIEQDGFDDLYVMYDQSGNEVDDLQDAHIRCNPFSGCSLMKDGTSKVSAFSDLNGNTVVYGGSEYMGTTADSTHYMDYVVDSRRSYQESFEKTQTWYNKLGDSFNDMAAELHALHGLVYAEGGSVSGPDITPPNVPEQLPADGSLRMEAHLGAREYSASYVDMLSYLDTVQSAVEGRKSDLGDQRYEELTSIINTQKQEVQAARQDAVSFQDQASETARERGLWEEASDFADVAPTVVDRSQKYAEMLREQLAGDQYESSREFIDEYAQTRANLEEEILELERQKQRDTNRKNELESELKELENKEELTRREEARMDKLELHIESYDAVIKDTRKQIREKNRELGSNELLLKAKAVVDENWRGLSVIGSILSTATFTNSVTNMLADKDILNVGWSKDGDSAYDKAMGRFNEHLEQGAEGLICKNKIGSGSDSLKANFDGGGTARSAAYVAGIRTKEGEVDGVTQYSYTLNAMVQNAKSNEGNLSFSLLLKSSEGGGQVVVTLDYDHENRPVTTVSIAPGSGEEWVKGSMLHYPGGDEATPQKFDLVCFKFHEDVRDFFDLTRNTNQFCRRLEKG